jgi:uncharacterized membrane protein YsdA (DUF1294 family)
MTVLFICISAMNLLLFALMGVDKARARKGARRIPEATLFLLAMLGGSLGGICSMYAFRHKTLHRSFRLGFPLILLCQLALAAFLYLKWKGLIP